MFTSKHLWWNRHDFALISLFLLIFTTLGYGFFCMHGAINHQFQQNSTLTVSSLPYDSLRTMMRLLIGLIISLIFAIGVGYCTAKNRHFANVMLPLINFLESVPLIGFLSFSSVFFMSLYPNNIMGIEYAAIFGVFTSQVWNMALSVHQSLRIIPNELIDMASVFKMDAWSCFWQIELPYAFSGLLYNTKVSQSAAWFAIVATEAIPVGSHTVMLPGIGSFIALALEQMNISALLFAVTAMTLNIVILDQLLFRPLMVLSEACKFEKTCSQHPQSNWLITLFSNSLLIQKLSLPNGIKKLKLPTICIQDTLIIDVMICCWYVVIGISCISMSILLWQMLPAFNLWQLLYLMLLTTFRVTTAIILSLIIFIPIGVIIANSHFLTRIIEPVTQVLGAIPPNIFYPIAAIVMLSKHISLSYWTIPLIMLGTQWYILFNVIAGVKAIGQDIRDVKQIFKINGWRYYQKILLPAIFPSIVTGIISAAGGAWNTAIMAEWINWGKQTLSTPGLGEYIAKATSLGHNDQAALGCLAMCLLVALSILFVWEPLYRLAENKFKL